MPSERLRQSVASRSSSFIQRSLLTTGTRLLDLPSRYGLHLLIATRLPVAVVGAFYIVFSTMTLASGFGRVGLDRALTREVAGAFGQAHPGAAGHVIRQTFWLMLLQSVIIAGGLALIAAPLATHVLHKPGLVLPLVLGALTIVPQNISIAAAGALAGLGRVATSQMIYSWLWPALFCAGALILPMTVQRTLVLIGGSLLLTAVVGVLLMLRFLPENKTAEGPTSVKPLYKTGLSFFSLELMQLSISSLPSFLLGIFASTTDVGRYAVAWRIVMVLNLLVSAIAAMAAPQFARLHAAGERRALARVAAQAVGLSLALGGLPIAVLASSPVTLLGFFGPGYAPAAPVLRLLLAGQAAMVLCTALPELLGMPGHARSLTRINLCSLALLCVLLLTLSRRFGPEGAAGAVSLTMIVNCIAIAVAVKKDVGFLPLFALRAS